MARVTAAQQGDATGREGALLGQWEALWEFSQENPVGWAAGGTTGALARPGGTRPRVTNSASSTIRGQQAEGTLPGNQRTPHHRIPTPRRILPDVT